MDVLSHEKHVIVFENIRNLEEMQSLVLYASSEALFAYRLFLEKYRYDEMPAFQRRFLEEWLKPFHNIPKIEPERQKGIVY